jgi:hypothetical protein
MGELYIIKKTLIKDGKKSHVFVTDGYSEVLEIKHRNIAEKFCEVMNDNSDSGCSYEVIPVGPSK